MREENMGRRTTVVRLNAPTKRIWLLSLILVIIAVVGQSIRIPYVTEYAFRIVVAGYFLLFLSTLVKAL